MECERGGTGREDVVSERVGVSRDDGDDDIWWLLSKSVCDAAGDSVVDIPSGKPSFCRNASDMSKFGGRTDRDVRGASASYGDMFVGDAEREAVMEIVSVFDDRLRSKTCNEAIGPEDERAEVLVERDFGVIASDLFSTFTGFVSVCGDAWVLPRSLRLAKSRPTVAPPQRQTHESVGPKAPSSRLARRSWHAGKKLVHGAVTVFGVCWARWHECRDLQRRPLACLARDPATPRTQSPKPRRQ